MEIISDTIENGEIENVHIAPIGDFKGSDNLGNSIDEHITAESLKNIADRLNVGDEVLCDVDHQSCKPGVNRDSKAAGWFHKFFVDPIKGLFANLKLTKNGKELLQNREYRYMSPVFSLNSDGIPEDLHSVALTNVPAFKGYIQPILNSEPISNDISTQKDILNMEIDELKKIIRDTIAEIKAEEEAKDKSKIKDDVKEDMKEEVKEVKEEAMDEAPVEEPMASAENACASKGTSNNEEPVSEPVKAEVKEDMKEGDKEVIKEEVKEEVIKIESLNSAPMPSVVEAEPEWKKLSGKAFRDYIESGKYLNRS